MNVKALGHNLWNRHPRFSPDEVVDRLNPRILRISFFLFRFRFFCGHVPPRFARFESMDGLSEKLAAVLLNTVQVDFATDNRPKSSRSSWVLIPIVRVCRCRKYTHPRMVNGTTSVG